MRALRTRSEGTNSHLLKPNKVYFRLFAELSTISTKLLLNYFRELVFIITARYTIDESFMFIQIYFLIRSQSILVSEYHETCYFYFQNAAITIPFNVHFGLVQNSAVTFDHYYFGLLTAVALSSEREKL